MLAIGTALVAAPWLTTSLTAQIVMPSALNTFHATRVTPDSLKPDTCIGPATMQNLEAGSGTVNGTTANDLVLGSAGDDTLVGGEGDDCLVGGGGNDTIYGGPGVDVLVGDDGYDTCIGSPTDIYDPTCEVQQKTEL